MATEEEKKLSEFCESIVRSWIEACRAEPPSKTSAAKTVASIRSAILVLSAQLFDYAQGVNKSTDELREQRRKDVDTINSVWVARVKKLEQKIAALEAKKREFNGKSLDDLSVFERIDRLESEIDARSYRGTWAKNDRYEKHNLVTASGSLWIAERDPVGAPGQHASGWRLAAKHGKDVRP